MFALRWLNLCTVLFVVFLDWVPFWVGTLGLGQVFWITFRHPVDLHVVQPSEASVRLRRKLLANGCTWIFRDLPSLKERLSALSWTLLGWHLRIWKHSVLIRPVLRFKVEGPASCRWCSYFFFVVFWIARTFGLPKEFQQNCLLCRETASQACSALSMVRPCSWIQHNAQLLFAWNCVRNDFTTRADLRWFGSAQR